MQLLSWLGLIFCAMLIGGAQAQQRPGRVALVIGNAAYPDASTPLSTTIRDARTISDELRRFDFEVELKENLSKEEMQRRAYENAPQEDNEGQAPQERNGCAPSPLLGRRSAKTTRPSDPRTCRGAGTADGNIRGPAGQTAAAAMAGQDDVAKSALQELRRAQPNISLGWIASQMPIKLEADRERYLEGFRRVGLD
jgi:hypothetical protein